MTCFTTPDRADSTANGTRILPVPLLGLGGSSFAADGVVPQAVEVLPVLADDLRPRVFLPGVLRRDLLAPLGHERGRRRLPVRGERGRGSERTATRAKRKRESMRGSEGLANGPASAGRVWTGRLGPLTPAVRLSVRHALGDPPIRIDAAVAEERPVPPHVFHQLAVALHDQDFFLVVARLLAGCGRTGR